MGQGVAQTRLLMSAESLMLVDGYMGFILLFFHVLGVFHSILFFFFSYLDGLFVFITNLTTVSHTLGFPCSILT